MSRTMTIHDFLRNDQIEKAKTIWESDRDNFHKRVLAEIIEPNMPAINAKLGQENNASFLAYAVEHVFKEASR